METNTPEASDADRVFAMFIAMVIRNAMEDFHSQHLSDEQMKQLNPIIRNAICTALHAFFSSQLAPAKRFIDYNFHMIPKYWEQPELLEGYVRMWDEGPFGGWKPE